MPSKIQPNHNTRSSSLPMDEEVEAVIVIPYILDPVSGEYQPQNPSSVSGSGIDPVSIKDPVTPANRLTVTADGRIGVNNFPAGFNILNTPLDVVVVETEPDVTDTRIDYQARTDGNPEYVGKATQGTLPSETGWIIQKLIYDASARLTRVQTIIGIWDNRITLGWT